MYSSFGRGDGDSDQCHGNALTRRDGTGSDSGLQPLQATTKYRRRKKEINNMGGVGRQYPASEPWC